jgi:hypothetical protein
MRLFIALIVIIYLVGVGVALSSTIRDKWNTATAADFTSAVVQQLPFALAWPVRAFHSIVGKPVSPEPPTADRPQ